ncbi:hypothetical protein A6X21_13320 [Planctopirus hydrillae]|uniref:Uncharacterized protein n=1 Tax=Planctopirus hydrillae TaxID=1841610 RepID=A0A1C3E5Y9_9PLAN|nr:hypothetical protein A6X21_13320 [Planctopirus hydrillae]
MKPSFASSSETMNDKVALPACFHREFHRKDFRQLLPLSENKQVGRLPSVQDGEMMHSRCILNPINTIG